jgi:hypothetical protein
MWCQKATNIQEVEYIGRNLPQSDPGDLIAFGPVAFRFGVSIALVSVTA